MKFVVLLLFGWFWSGTEAQDRTYLVVAPLSFRLDAVEKVVLQVFGFLDPVAVYVSLRKTMAHDHISQQQVVLSAANRHQGEVEFRLFPGDVDNKMDHVILHVQSSAGFQENMAVPLSRTNGFLVVQTDKPLYTPRQPVKVRAFSLNQELRPASRSVFLTFRDPDYEKVSVVEVRDVSNGMPSLKNPFKIPLNPKLGIWTLEASYMEHFDTEARTTFEVREYVLPSFTILIEPAQNYISHNNFKNFMFKVSAKYLHGAPVSNGEMFLRYGFVRGTSSPVIIPSSVTREQLSEQGELQVSVNLEDTFSRGTFKTVDELKDKFLYIAVLLREETGGISEEAELQSVKFVQSPFFLDLVSTPPFIKPGLPYNIQVLVKDHQGEPVSQVPVQLKDRHLRKPNIDLNEELYCSPSSSTSGDNGIAAFSCNINIGAASIDMTVVTVMSLLPAQSQATLRLNAESYDSPNARYLYIDSRPISAAVGSYAQVPVHSVAVPYLQVSSLNYLIMSKGKVVKFGWIPFEKGHHHMLSFEVTPEMVPSIRLLVYYMPYGANTAELVSDSVWLNIKGECVNGIQTEVKTRGTHFKPQQELQMDVTVNQDGYIALSAVDTGVYSLRPNYKDPIERILRHLETADQGCGGGGGRNAADVFRLAGLKIMTNAVSGHTSSSEPCRALVRPRRYIPESKKEALLEKYPHEAMKNCCHLGMKYSPSYQTCADFAQTRFRNKHCRNAFTDCCVHIQRFLNPELINGRSELGGDFGNVPSLVRSAFPESWLWKVQRLSRGSTSVSEVLPDSLTTWRIKTVGMFDNGICVAKTAEVSVNLPLSLNVPLPYQIVRGEQVQLVGSVYNEYNDPVKVCVSLTVGPELCLAGSQAAGDGSRWRSTSCTLDDAVAVSGSGALKVDFTVMALEAGQHQLTFKLYAAEATNRARRPLDLRDTVVKTLTVVPEGKLHEEMVGGRLDPQGLYGSDKTVVHLESAVPPNIVPNTEVKRMLTINGELLDEWVSIVDDPEGLKKMLALQDGTVVSELGGILPVFHVYQYLETTSRWGVLGPDTLQSSNQLKDRMREGLSGLGQFKRKDFSYSMFLTEEPSTWVTALAVQTLAMVHSLVTVDLDSLSESVSWLIRKAGQADGSFRDASLYKPNKIMALPNDNVEKSVYLTSFVIIALHKATRIQTPEQQLQLKFQEDRIQEAIKFVSKNINSVKKVYVVAVATYALTLHDTYSSTASDLLNRLETLSNQRGNPPTVRYWQEPGVRVEWLKPDQSSAQTVETTAYALLSFLLKGRFQYCNPIVTWLTQDQHYGGGYFSLQDTLMTLEAVTFYSQQVPRSDLDQYIRLSFSRESKLDREVHLSRRAPVASPIEISKNSAVTARTAFGRGVSHVKLKTIYYQTIPPQKNCYFDIKLELMKSGSVENGLKAPHLVACAQFKPPPNEPLEESLLTVMEIELPTGIEPLLVDLKPLKDGDAPIVASYRLVGRTVFINIYAVPSDRFLCVGFRIRTAFVVGGTSDTFFTVYEDQDKGSKCTKQVSDKTQKIHRLCQYDQCQCITAVCSLFRGTVDPKTANKETLNREICRPQVRYAYKVKVTHLASEGDFSILTATVVEVIKRHTDFEAVSGGSEVDFIKKTTCNSVDLQTDQQYLISGSTGLEVVHNGDYRYRFPLDSEAVIQVWPTNCGPECSGLVSFSFLAQLQNC